MNSFLFDGTSCLFFQVYKVLLETDFFMPPDTVEIIDGLTEG